MKLFLTLLFTLFTSTLLFSQYNISTPGSVSTCSGTFFDSGGTGGNYSDGENFVKTFCSDNSTCISVTFTSFNLDSSDILFIYDGPNTASTPIAVLTGNVIPVTYSSFFGCLTFQFVSNDTITAPGWAANFSCNTCTLSGGGSGSLSTSYDKEACGLNYTQVSNKVTTRYPTPPGTGLPSTLNLTGLPPNGTCWAVEKALLYWTESSQNNNPVTLTVTNPQSTVTNFNVSPVGTGVAKCWGELNTKNFRVDVSSTIVGNGNYTVNISSGVWPVDGVTLLVVYRDLTATYTGRLMINDGTLANSSGDPSFAVISNINACAASTSASAFLMVGDMQDNTTPTYTGTLNGNNYNFTKRFWNFDQAATSVTAGQTTASFGVSPGGGDCYSLVAVGLYYQTNCMTCPASAFSVPITQTVVTCGGGDITANPGGASPPYTYLWSPGNQTTQSLTNLPPGTYTVTVTDAVGCTAQDSITVVNNSTPVMNATSNISVCSGDNVPASNFSSNLTGTTYTWTNSNTAIGLAASGSGNTPAFTATNSTSNPITGTITVTPSANGCTGTPVVYTITVNPLPTVNTISNITVCNGDNVPTSNYGSPTTGVTYSWTNTNTNIGLGASGTGNIPSFTATNSTTNPITATITVTATVNGCTGSPTTYTITVNPTPIISMIPNDTVCSGTNVTALTPISSVNGTTFSWTNSNTAIGLGTSGTGSVPAFTATNTTSNPITGTITVTPTANGCSGTPITYTITVNPSPIVDPISNIVVCVGDIIPLSNYTSTTVGSTFDWINSNTAIGLGASGTGNIPSFTATNTTSNPITGTVSVTATANGCTGLPTTYTITVNPITTFSPTVNICDGDSIFLGGGFQTTSGTFNDTIFGGNIFGCDSVIATNLIVNPTPSNVLVTGLDTICLGDSLIFSATGTVNGIINWYADASGSTLLDTGITFAPIITSTGTFTYYFNEILGNCVGPIDSFTVFVDDVTAVINAAPTSGILPLEVYFGNGSQGATSYFWDFGDGNTSTSFDPTHIYNDEGILEVMLMATNGICYDTAFINIETTPTSSFVIPNVFTPNGDNNNDIFYVKGENLESVEVEIYNRWGQLMFSWNHVKGYWDGRTLSGSEAPDGTYFYIVNAKGFDGTEYFKKGGFSLIR